MCSENKSNWTGQERRLAFRTPIRVLKVSIENSCHEIFFGYAKDLSSMGMQIRTSNPKDVGSKFNISFKLPDGNVSISCEATVVWFRDYNPNIKEMPRMGIKFTQISPDNKREIEEYIKKNS